MASGYGVCPTCGRPHGTWHGGHMMVGPPWVGGQGMMGGSMGPGPGWGSTMAGPAIPYVPGYPPAYYGGVPSDSEIEEMIYDALDADPMVPYDVNIDVGVEDGAVYLEGEVPNKRIKQAAGNDAWWQPGVVDVHNEIKIVPRRRPDKAKEKPEEK
jgi:hypothetical protein